MRPAIEAPAILQSGIPPVPDTLRERLDQYLNTRPAILADIAPENRGILIATRFATTAQLHFVEKPMGARQQITFRREPVTGGKFVPSHPNLVLFGQDIGGGEAFQFFVLNRKTGRTRMLTDGTSRHSSLAVYPQPLPSGNTRVAYSSTDRNGRDTDVLVADLNLNDPTTTFATTSRRLTQQPGTWAPLAFSPDGKHLLIAQFRAIDDADLHLLHIDTGETQQLTPSDGQGSIRDAEFSADGLSILFVTDRYSDFNHLYRIPLLQDQATGKLKPGTLGRNPIPVSTHQPWNIEGLAVAASGLVAYATNEDGISKVYLLTKLPDGQTTPTSIAVELPSRGVLSSLRFPPDHSNTLFLAMDSSRSPNDIFSLDVSNLQASASSVELPSQRWTRGEVGGLDTSSFIEPEIVRYPSTDDFTIPAILFRPQARPGERLPVLIIWHGGPEGQSRPNFSAFVQFLVQELRLAVLLPNVRGSDGYGKAFLAADNGVLRERSLNDIGATLDWIATQPDLDPDRVGAYGGSYGGYMTLATATFYANRIRAAVNVVGISSIPTFLQNTQEYRRDLRRVEYGDERDPQVRKVQERISPLNFVQNITAALFVQHGKNDPRVPQSEAEQIVAAVRAHHNGDPDTAWYMLALNEGHGFARRDNRDHALAATVLFLQKHLIRPGTENPSSP
jgi:dipeptidyl aminopeptidase/acylaminoacyl peptidase